jgi:transposase
MKDIWEFIKKKLINAQQSQKRHADHKKDISSKYKEEHMIWLLIKNIKTERSFRKLNHKWIESYKVKKVLRDVCQLNLSSSMKIHNTFHISLLRSASSDSLTEQIQSSSSSIVINEEEEYEVDDILNNQYHYDKLQYRIAWTDHSSNRAWYLAENFQNHSKEILNDYHQRYFQKTESSLRLIIIIEAMLSQWIKNEHKKTKQLIHDVLNKMKANMNDQKRFSKDSFATNVLAREESWVSAY